MFQNAEILPGFIVIEGIDGAGTSTQRSQLCQRMKSLNMPIYETFEPTDGPIGVLIRSALKKELLFTPETLCHLFAADRSWHTSGPNGISARCQAGTWVISDRYVFSSYAYQSLQLPLSFIAQLNGDFPLPSDVFFIEVDDETGEQRRVKRGAEPEIYETAVIQSKVRKNYQQVFETLSRERPEVKIHQLDGRLSIKELHQSIWNILGFSPIQE